MGILREVSLSQESSQRPPVKRYPVGGVSFIVITGITRERRHDRLTATQVTNYGTPDAKTTEQNSKTVESYMRSDRRRVYLTRYSRR